MGTVQTGRYQCYFEMKEDKQESRRRNKKRYQKLPLIISLVFSCPLNAMCLINVGCILSVAPDENCVPGAVPLNCNELRAANCFCSLTQFSSTCSGEQTCGTCSIALLLVFPNPVTYTVVDISAAGLTVTPNCS